MQFSSAPGALGIILRLAMHVSAGGGQEKDWLGHISQQQPGDPT